MTPADFAALAERVEGLTSGNDRGLEIECAVALGLPPRGYRRGSFRDEWTDGHATWTVPSLFSDPAAPLRLIEQRWPDALTSYVDYRDGTLEFSADEAFGKSRGGDLPGRLARAATAAALRLAARSADHA